MPYWVRFDLDEKSLVFVVAAASVSCLLAGLVPAWRLSRPNLNVALRDSARGSTGAALGRFMHVLVAVEIALSCALLVLTGLNIRSMLNIASARLGYETAGVFAGSVYPSGPAYPTADRRLAFVRGFLERLNAHPDVVGAAATTTEPTWQSMAGIVIEQRTAGDARQQVACAAVQGDYFGVLGIRRLRGRAFDERDSRTAERVAIINPVLAERAWPGVDPIGRRFRFGREGDPKPRPWITVVGVVAATLQGRFYDKETAQVYVPLTQHDDVGYVTVYAKARGGDGANLASVLRQVLRHLDPDLAVINPATLTNRVERAKVGRRLWVPTYVLFGAAALVLAGVGLYGVMSYGVARRIPEIGVRMALGATPGRIVWLIVRQAGLQVLAGLLAGSVIAYFFARQFGTAFFNVAPHDPPTYLLVVATLTLAALLACLVPVWRAVRVSPVDALRSE
jgi:predicted permease